MNFKQLKTFALVAELGSLSRAAKASDTVPSLVSRQIALLEAEWGDRLFERTGRGMALSGFGRRMLAETSLVLEQVDRLEGVAKETAGELTGTVHIGVLPSMSRQLLPLLMADVRASAPAVKLHVVEGFSGNLDEQLTSGRLDMMVVNRYGTSGLRGEDVLGTVETCLIGKPGAGLLTGKSVLFRELAGVPLVLPSTPNGLRATLDQLSRKHDVELNVVMEVDTATAMKDVAISGHAFTLLPLMAVREELAAKTLTASQITRPAIKRTIALSLSTHRPLSKAARFVATRLRKLASKVLHS
jgi:LysR family nitrogen assimilation transcriptional regulator